MKLYLLAIVLSTATLSSYAALDCKERFKDRDPVISACEELQTAVQNSLVERVENFARTRGEAEQKNATDTATESTAPTFSAPATTPTAPAPAVVEPQHTQTWQQPAPTPSPTPTPSGGSSSTVKYY